MAVRKKGSRRIVVEGILYLWRFPGRMTQSQEDGWPGVKVTVMRADYSSSSLMLAFPQRFHINGPVVQDPPRPVLPSDVAAGIRAALASGWVADKPGKQFMLLAPKQME